MTQARDFSDLTVRVASAVCLVVVAALMLWWGVDTFRILLVISAGIMVWETAKMHSSSMFNACLAGLITAIGLGIAFWGGVLIGLALGVFGLAVLPLQKKSLVIPVAIFVAVSCWFLSYIHANDGVFWCLWLVVCVVASDVGGYFGGKLIGGPKFWPAISPKKTWAGILTGWAASAAVSVLFDVIGWTMGAGVIGGVAIAIASQAGDILESAMKRRAGLKDSSHIIPGHGGFLDRFDAMLLASLVTGLYSIMFGGLA